MIDGCRLRLLISATIGAVFVGCASSSDPQPLDKAAPSKAAAPTPAVEILSWDETQKRREQFRGKVVVLDVWSTYCEPCVREFPGLVALQKRFADKSQCISFDTDYAGDKNEPPESFRKRVLEFLTAKNAMLLNVIASDASEALFDKLKLGGPPAVYVYGQSGKLIKRFDNSVPKRPEFTYAADVAPLVEKLVAEPQ